MRVYLFCDLIPDAAGGVSAGGPGSGLIGVGGTTGGTGAGDGSGPPVTTPPVIPPPVAPPPVVTPPSVPNPVLLPPEINIPTSLGGPVLPANPDQVLIGIAELAEVWFLDEDAYRQVTSQDDVNTLVNMGIQGVAASSALHTAILAAASREPSVVLGPEILSGWWQAVQRLGVAARRD